MNVFSEFEKIAKRLQQRRIPYALVGGVALSFYTAPRATIDVDILILSSGLKDVADILTMEGYVQYADPWTFQNDPITLHRFVKMPGDEDIIILDILVSDSSRHAVIVENAWQTPDSAGTIVRIARKEDLIWLKEKRNSKQDQADIESLQMKNPSQVFKELSDLYEFHKALRRFTIPDANGVIKPRPAPGRERVELDQKKRLRDLLKAAKKEESDDKA